MKGLLPKKLNGTLISEINRQDGLKIYFGAENTLKTQKNYYFFIFLRFITQLLKNDFKLSYCNLFA